MRMAEGPFWIAVNMLLRALGLYGSPSTGFGPASANQLASFVLSSLVVGDGSGAAEIAAAQVTPVLGTSVETQFQFQGSISSQKPFRDWLTEVLNCCLGFYTWEFGSGASGEKLRKEPGSSFSITRQEKTVSGILALRPVMLF
jgi:hypothetical protein